MLRDLKLRPISEIPFGGLLWDAAERPVLFDNLLPGLDLLIWRKPGARELTTPELRKAAYRVLDLAIENSGKQGAAVYDFDGYALFAFQTAQRSAILDEMGSPPVLMV